MTNMNQDRLNEEVEAVKAEIKATGRQVVSCKQFQNGSTVIVSDGDSSDVYVLTMQAGTVSTRVYPRTELLELLTLTND